MEQTLQSITDWLNSRKNRPLSIRKEEEGDTDLVDLRLEEINLRHRHPYDDYIADYAIILKGEGGVRNGEDSVPLPGGAFEIPITGTLQSESAQDRLTVKTDRATYILQESR